MAGTQTDNPQPETNEPSGSRVNLNIVSQEEYAPNEAPPTMNNPQPEASHHMITERIVVKIDQATMTESEEDTPLFHKKSFKMCVAYNSLPLLPEKTEI